MGVSWRLDAVCLVPIALLEGSSVCIVKIKEEMIGTHGKAHCWSFRVSYNNFFSMGNIHET